MQVAIRADAALALGSGHVMRCLALAEELRAAEARVEFVSREVPGHALDVVRSAGFQAHSLPPDVEEAGQDAELTLAVLSDNKGPRDWLVVDHYGLDARWESRMREATRGILVIDDLADRDHDCDLVVDQNLAVPSRYIGRVPTACQVLAGPRYAILRREFPERRRTTRPRPGVVQRILVMFGGTDPTRETMKVLEALEPLAGGGIAGDVVVGYGNTSRDLIERRARSMAGWRAHVNTRAVADLMAAADLSIGACGTTTWERCCLGLPSLVLVVADNQEGVSQAVVEAGAAMHLGRAGDVSPSDIRRGVEALLEDPARVAEMSSTAWKLTDGLGAKRVGEVLLKQRSA